MFEKYRNLRGILLIFFIASIAVFLYSLLMLFENGIIIFQNLNASVSSMFREITAFTESLYTALAMAVVFVEVLRKSKGSKKVIIRAIWILLMTKLVIRSLYWYTLYYFGMIIVDSFHLLFEEVAETGTYILFTLASSILFKLSKRFSTYFENND